MIEIYSRLLERIYCHAKDHYPHECCGILVGQGGRQKRVEEIFETVNAEVLRDLDRYRIDGKNFLEIDKRVSGEGLEIIGFYHSHPGAFPNPSEMDRSLAWAGYSYMIVSLQRGRDSKAASWMLDDTGQFIEERVYLMGQEGSVHC